MAQVEEFGSSGRSKNVELNLVPFVDLMSVCIIFLLITAVWTQVSMIQIGSSVYGKRTEFTPSEPPPRPEISFRVDVNASGYIVNVSKGRHVIPLKDGEHDDFSLYNYIKSIKDKYPQKEDSVIALSDEMTYNHLIRGMDVLLNAGFPEISVATGSVR